jgi:hypothetical protein
MHPRAFLSLALAAVALGAVACAWSVPADPGENARRRSAQHAGASPVQAIVAAPGRASAPSVAALYAEKCGQCHAPFPATYASAEEWPVFVRRYGPRAGLFGAERARVLSWLQANAR